MNELFRTELDAAELKLMKKGYYLCNMLYDNTEYELYKGEDIAIDHLSVAQVIQLSNIL